MKLTADTKQLDNWNEFMLDGNPDALSRVYFHFYDFLFDLGRRYTADKQLVEDVIQDIFINFIKHRKRIGIVKNLNGYLVCSYRRQLFIDINKQKKVTLTNQLPEGHFEYFKSPDEYNSDNENTERLHSAINQCLCTFTDRQREIIFLRFEKEISYEEISIALNISVDSCYKSTYRAIKIIRSEVEKIFGKELKIFLLMFHKLVN